MFLVLVVSEDVVDRFSSFGDSGVFSRRLLIATASG